MKDLIEKHLKCVDTMMAGDAMFSDEILEIVRKYTTNWTAAHEEADNLCKETTYCHICEAELKEENILKLHEQATCETCYDTYTDGVKDEAIENIAYLKQTLEDRHGCFKAHDIYEHIIDHAIMVRES